MGRKNKQPAQLRPLIDDEPVVKNGILSFCREFRKYDAARLFEIWSPDDDGYSLAKSLELYGMQPDEEMVSELGQLESYVYDSLAAAERRWVKENDIQLRIKEGQSVLFQLSGKQAIGVIRKTDKERAIYYIARENDPDKSRVYHVYAERVHVSFDSCNSGEHKPWPCPSCGLGPCMNISEKIE